MVCKRGGLIGLVFLVALAACTTPQPAPVVAPTPVPTPAPVAEAPPAPVFTRNDLLAKYIDLVKRKIRNKVLTCSEEKVAAAKRRGKAAKSSNVCFPDNSANLETLFQIGLLPDMTISDVKIVHGSGDSRYDAAATAAIKRAGSYPPLLEGLEFAPFASHKIRYKLNDTPQ